MSGAVSWFWDSSSILENVDVIVDVAAAAAVVAVVVVKGLGVVEDIMTIIVLNKKSEMFSK